jgi:choline dehydrogenase-like flavoprotein
MFRGSWTAIFGYVAERYDVIIVGSGAGGDTLAHTLAPSSYDDLEPWYTKAEWLYQVHGIAGEDPTEGHHSKEYPWPPVSHEVDNLYVVDTSFFPSIGAVNPALTAMANAIRVGDHLLSRMA